MADYRDAREALRALLELNFTARMSGAALEDRAASLARQYNALGITADPGRFGGVVLYPTAEQAKIILDALDDIQLPEGKP